MHGQKYMHKLLELVLNGELDPSFVAYTLPLEQAPHGYEIFNRKKTIASRLYSNHNRSLLIANC